MSTQSQFRHYRLLEAQDMHQANHLCVSAMQDNPTHIRIFGSEQTLCEQRLQRFFKHLLSYSLKRGYLYGVFVGHNLIGVFGMLKPGFCHPRGIDALKLVPAIWASHSLGGTYRTIRWLNAWHKHDFDKPHWHLGPLAIHPDWQAQGHGKALIEHVRQRVDFRQLPGWLETDKKINVSLYEHYGFSVVKTARVLGVHHWFMQGSL